jgi:hypothetical protein
MNEQIFNPHLIGLGLSPESSEREPMGVGATGPSQGPTMAHVPGSNVSSALPGGGYIPQKSGDPNYYPTTPKFDSRGFWHCAGTMAPTDATLPGVSLLPRGVASVAGLGQIGSAFFVGRWVKQGQVQRNGLATNLWVWYPKGNDVPIVSSDTGSYFIGNDANLVRNTVYTFLTAGIVGSTTLAGLGQQITPVRKSDIHPKRLFSNPDYWVLIIPSSTSATVADTTATG